MKLATQLFAPLSFALLSFSALSTANVIPADGDISEIKQAFFTAQQQQGFSEQAIEDYFNNAQYEQKVIDAITTPWEAKPWHQYYPIFLTEKRLEKGLAFWQQHEATITRAADQFNVDPQIIVAIIGIETFYGGYMGNYPVKDALFTLGFYYTPRADFFRREFGHLQKLVEEEQLDINQLKGSYAGAMGFGQFIPSSYRAYAVDFDNDGRRDLLNSTEDAIGSVANYFHQHGWQRGAPVTLALTDDPRSDNIKLWDNKKPHYQVKDILSPTASLQQSTDIDVTQKAIVIELEQADNNEYWLGLNNFYVITRYNRSPLYAMAVYQFSQQLQAAFEAK
ncbi:MULTISPECIES: lytic murein transglycosylase B [Shewanella]|uniref:lytic murein transglycosylase B n=1 Tax=Shewanella TaxID=22 RepID=UPI000491075D|nr:MULTISPECIES: lytic murein transglycosylase B [Shewanella]QLE86468.1 lytic murein transglycosylase B [Shewanella sp. Scap07]